MNRRTVAVAAASAALAGAAIAVAIALRQAPAVVPQVTPAPAPTLIAFGPRTGWLVAETPAQIASLPAVQRWVDYQAGGYPWPSNSLHQGKPRAFFGPTALRTTDPDPFASAHRIAPQYSNSTVANLVAMPLDAFAQTAVQNLIAMCAAGNDAGTAPLICIPIANLTIVASLPPWWDGDGATPWFCDAGVRTCAQPSTPDTDEGGIPFVDAGGPVVIDATPSPI